MGLLHQVGGLTDGRPYRFYVAAFNRQGVEVNSPVRSVIAATVSEEAPNKPTIVDVDTNSIEIKWSLPPGHPNPSGSPITGYKVYQFPGVGLNSPADMYPVKREIQQIYTIVDTPQAEIQQILTTTSAGSVGGTFKLSYKNEETAAITHGNNLEAAIVSAITGLTTYNPPEGTPAILVYETAYTNGGYNWTVEFPKEVGDVEPLVVTYASAGATLTPEATVSATVTTLTTGRAPLSGDFSVLYNGRSGLEETPHLRYDCTALDMKRALENLDGINVVDVSSSTYNIYGKEWTVTFLTEVSDLRGRYYDNQYFLQTPVISRIDSNLDFNWGTGLLTSFAKDYVTVRWNGKISPPTTETYTLYLMGDDGVRLYIDHQLMVDTWTPTEIDSVTEHKFTVSFTKNQFHDIRIDYKETTGNAMVRLQWQSLTQKKQPIPSKYFFLC